MVLPELAALEGYRLDQDWTWTRLAANMAGAGQPVPMRTLHYLCKRAPAAHRPLDRTMHKIRKYLAFAHVAYVPPPPPVPIVRVKKKTGRAR